MRVTKNIFTRAGANVFLTDLIKFFKNGLPLNNYSNSPFLVLKNISPIFYCSKRKNHQFVWINLLVENRLNGEFCWHISLDFPQILLTTTTFSFSLSSLVSFVFLFLSLVYFAFVYVCVLCVFYIYLYYFLTKIYILIHIRLWGWVSDKKFSLGRFPETRLLFFSYLPKLHKKQN